MPEMGFSDHIFMYWLPPEERDPVLAMPERELDPYVQEVERLRCQFPEIRLRLALEADYIVGAEEQLKSVLERYQWDYLIGSVHFVDGWGIDDQRYIAGYDQWDIDELYEVYFDHVCRAAETGQFEVMGHIDLIKIFGRKPRRVVAELHDRTARRLKQAGVCIEVNTSGLRRPCAEIYPGAALLAACYRAGVPATLGSDAHRPDHVAADSLRAVELLREVGYGHIITFEGRRWHKQSLP